MEKKPTSKQLRCPRLGDEMTLSYCLKESGNLPCARIVPCWSPCFDIVFFLEKFMTPDDLNKFINYKPKDKVISLIELIETAKAKK
jgi:hypothetical protein